MPPTHRRVPTLWTPPAQRPDSAPPSTPTENASDLDLKPKSAVLLSPPSPATGEVGHRRRTLQTPPDVAPPPDLFTPPPPVSNPAAIGHHRLVQHATAAAATTATVAIPAAVAHHRTARSGRSGADLAIYRRRLSGETPGLLRVARERSPTAAVLVAVRLCRRPLGRLRGGGGRWGREKGRPGRRLPCRPWGRTTQGNRGPLLLFSYDLVVRFG
uniref:Uncharacterized protein n=1 Tax=Oryza meridionalis TaxID=40149 RepID=A0A0E0EXF6_9ORYZ